MGARPFPLSITEREDRFSLSDDAEVAGEGDVGRVPLFRRRGGAGDALYISPSNKGEIDLLGELDMMRSRTGGARRTPRYCGPISSDTAACLVSGRKGDNCARLECAG